MKKVILRKLHRKVKERVTTIYFCYSTRHYGGVSHCTTIKMIKDDDVKALFDIYDSIKLQIGPKMYVIFQKFASFSTQS